MTEPTGRSEPFQTQRGRLQQSQRRLHELRPAVEAGEPWPLAARFGTEPEARWGPPEVLAHVAEMLPFWLGEIERILASPAEPGPFGRVSTDAIRIDVIERDRTLPARELFDRIDATLGRLERRLSQLTEAQAGRRGIHATRGEMTITELLERFVVGHLEDHAAQLEDALA